MSETVDESPEGDPLVWMLSGDLMFSSRVKATAQRNGLDFQISGSLPPAPLTRIRYVILDLSTRSGLIETISENVQRLCPQAELIAYGPHVHVGKLKAARQAGIARVLTNGQFDAQMAELLR